MHLRRAREYLRRESLRACSPKKMFIQKVAKQQERACIRIQAWIDPGWLASNQ